MSQVSRLTTPLQFIEYADEIFSNSDIFYGHGTDNAYDEAVYLVLRSLRIPFTVAEKDLHNNLSREQREMLLQRIDKRVKEKVPVAYLVNEAWFCGHPFYVDNRVLIPRSPMGELIENSFIPWIEPGRVKRILDIGTGSGSIAISCALAFPSSLVDAVDISTAALEIARINVHQYGLDDRVRIFPSDLYQQLDGNQYDLIISNPPYVNAGEMSSLPLEYGYEPEAALLAGTDGLDYIRRIIGGANQHLEPHGVLVVECGNSRLAVADAYPDLPFYWLEFEKGDDGVFLLQADDLKHISV